MGAAIVAVLVTDRAGSGDATSLVPLLGAAASAAHGGTMTRLTGALAVQFASVADSVDCAMELQRAAVGMNVRVGIHVGEQAPDEIGPPMLVAQQLCQRAGAGQILATGLVRSLDTRRVHRFRELSPDVHEVEWTVSASSRAGLSTALGVPADAPPFVDRRAELDQLLRAWADVRAGQRRAVFIGGEPGVGKTRLTAELAARTHAEGAVAVAGWCDEDLAVPYQAFAAAARAYLEWAPDLATQARLGRHVSELPRLVPELAHLGPPLVSDPDAERFALFEAVTALLAEGAAAAPLVLVLEDLQWAARPTVLLLRHLLRAADLQRLLLIGTYRDTELAPDHPLAVLLTDLRADPSVERIILSGLDAGSVRELLASSGHGDDSVELASALHAHTQGNPFFLAEMLRGVDQDGELGLPESVREVINRRLGRLDPRTVRALTVAAVVGPTFSFRLLESLPDAADNPDQLLDALDSAVAHRIVVELAGGEYAFAHALIRHALTADLGATRRARLHLRIATSIEALRGDDPAPSAAELALHYAAASDPSVTGKVIRFARIAGDRAIASIAAEDALHWYSLALEQLRAAPDEATEVRCRVGLGQAQRQSGDPGYRLTLLEAADGARRIGDTEALVAAALANNRGFVSVTGDVDRERVTVIEAALEAVGTSDSAARARLLALLALELTFSGDLEHRRALGVEALVIARRLEEPSVLAEVLDRRMLAIWAPATLAQRLAETAEAEALAEQTGNRVANFWAVYHRTITSLEAGDVIEMRRCSARSVALADQIGQPLVRWAALFNQCWQALLVGDVESANDMARQSMKVGVATGQPDTAVLSALALGVRWAQGGLFEMVPMLRDVVAASPGLPALVATLAVALAEGGERDEATDLLDRACGDDFSIPVDPVWLATISLWAEAASLVGHRDAAERLVPILEPWRDQVAFSGASVQGPVSHYLGALAVVLGRAAEADGYFGEAALVSERLEAPFFQARTALAHGCLLRSGDPKDVERGTELVRRARELAVRHGYALVESRADAALA